MSLENKIGSIIKDLRREQGLTQEDLAYKASISIDTVRKIEIGSHLLRLDMLFKIIQAFDEKPQVFYEPLWEVWLDQNQSSKS